MCIRIGHSTRQLLGGLVTTSQSSCSSSCLSSRSSVCPPLVRSAPGVSFFPSLSVPPPPAHLAFGGDDVGDRPLFSGAVVSVARHCFSDSFVSVGSSVSSLGSLRSVGPCSQPSCRVACARHSVKFRKSKCGNVSTQGGRRIVAASVRESGVAPTRLSSKVVLNRQVTNVDLGLANSNVAIYKPMPRDKQTFGSPSADGDTGGCLFPSALDGAVVGSMVFDHQPQKLPCGLRCVLRLQGGAWSTSSSDDGAATTFSHDGRVDSRLLDFNEAVGSGLGDDRRTLNDGDCNATHGRRRWSAGVLAREEGHQRRVVQEQVLHRVDYVFSFFWSSARYEFVQFEVRPPSLLPDDLRPPDVPRDVCGNPIGELPGVSLGSLLRRIGCYHYNGYYFDGNGQPVDPDQYLVDWRFSNVRIGPRIAFGAPRFEVREVVVQTNPLLGPAWKKPHNINQKRRNRRNQEDWHPLGELPKIGICFPWFRPYFDVSVQLYGPGYREVACGPSLYVNQLTHVGWKSDVLEVQDRQRRERQAHSVKEEFASCSSATPSVVEFALGVGGAHVVNAQSQTDTEIVCWSGALDHAAGSVSQIGASGSVVGRPNSIEVDPRSTHHISNSVAVQADSKSEEVFVGLCRFVDGPLGLTSHAPKYNKLIGGVRAAIDPIHLRNIKLGEFAVDDRWHIGRIERFATRTYIHGFIGRKSIVNCSIVRVKDGHHVGKNCFRLGCGDHPLLPLDCRIVYLDVRKLKWCSVDSVAFHSFKWPKDGRKAKSIVRTLSANYCNWADVLIVRGRCFRYTDGYTANRVLENLLWQWNGLKRPFVVYQQERIKYHRRDILPRWMVGDYTLRTHRNFCQCHLVHVEGKGWHRPGTLYSNVVRDFGEMYANPCSCFTRVGWRYPRGCTHHSVNCDVATGLSWIAMWPLQKAPPPVPPRSEKLDSFLDMEAWDEMEWGQGSERRFMRNVRFRYNQVSTRWTYGWGSSDELEEEGGESEECCEGDEEESSDEEGHARVG